MKLSELRVWGCPIIENQLDHKMASTGVGSGAEF